MVFVRIPSGIVKAGIITVLFAVMIAGLCRLPEAFWIDLAPRPVVIGLLLMTGLGCAWAATRPQPEAVDGTSRGRVTQGNSVESSVFAWAISLSCLIVGIITRAPEFMVLAGIGATWQLICRLDAQRELVRERLDQESRARLRTLERDEAHLVATQIHQLQDLPDFLDRAPELARRACRAECVFIKLNGGIAPSLRSGTLRWAGKPSFAGLDITEFLQDETNDIRDIELHAQANEVPQEHILRRIPLKSGDQVLGAIGVVASGEAEVNAMALEVNAALARLVLYEHAARSADRDYLTGLLSHRSISREFQEFFDAPNAGEHLGMLILDISNFKVLNDTHGHAVGDDVLKLIGRTVATAVGNAARVGRTGGDEFTLLVENGDLETTSRLADHVVRRVRALEFSVSGMAEGIPIEVNCGIASYPESSADPFKILAFADENLSQAKLRRVPIFQPVAQSGDEPQVGLDSFGTVDMMLTAIDRVDCYTRQHSQDVSRFAVWISEELGDSPDQTEIVRRSALMHDLGKIAIPGTILNRPGLLSDDEFEVLKMHPEIGATIARTLPGLEPMIDGIAHHHERVDGSGYPSGLMGDEIPRLGRIIAVADALSAMTTDRPYRKGMPFEIAARRLKRGSGRHFCPDCTQAMLDALEKYGLIFGVEDAA